MFMGVVDTAMVGRFSAEALAATGAANIWFFMVTTIGMGCIAALAPVIAQAYGAYDDLGVTRGPLLVAIVAANLLNALVNWVLILGHFGLPAIGVTGAAVAGGPDPST